MPETCPHAHATRVGYAEAPIDRPDDTMAGLAVQTIIRRCTDCGQLIVATSLWRGDELVMVCDTWPALRERTQGGETDD